ncbi:MAG: PQQ-binding-like beta-propeller repeat protein [Planctomycetaceae bacterium]|mgnify:CR=1 FL=1|nr:PQQ-binding-like beta-propeller repeat protein [Planctomycetaceae bacterium]
MKPAVHQVAARFFQATLCAVLLASTAIASDWPTAGSDIRRSNVSDEILDLPLAECWRHQPVHAPKPAWPEAPAKQDVYRKVYGLSPTVTFDRAFQPVVAGRRLYYGSSADDAVRCLDAATGEFLWGYGTEGPIRLAPTIHEGKVYFGSDDGCVYCLDAEDGKLLWKHRPVEPDRRLPGNGRIISLWPVRSGVLVDGGIAYFTAGLFPSQGAWLCAVEADSGRPVWKQQVDISPQGYLLASSNRLFVPTGRTTPHIYLREDGQQVAAFPGGGEQRAGFPQGGGSYALIVDDVLVHAGGEKRGLEFTATENREKIITSPGIRLVARGDTAYILDMDRLKAIHRARYIELLRLESKKEKTPADTQRIAHLRGPEKPAVLWDVPCAAPYAMVLTGNHVVCGGDESVVAFNAETGKQAWQVPVEGKAYSLATASKCLYAGTDRGTIYCFGNEAAGNPHPYKTPSTEGPLDSNLIVHMALMSCGTDAGYCLALGRESLGLAEEALKSSRMNVICVLSDEEQAATCRRSKTENPTSSSDRITYHAGSLQNLPFQSNTFNLILIETGPGSQEPPTPASEIMRLLRPNGGTLCLGASETGKTRETRIRETETRFEHWGSGIIPGLVLSTHEFALRGWARRGPLEAAGEWTHFYADPGNSACSGDSLPFGPVDIQWFGRPGPRRMVDRHEKNMAPLYKDGRMFVTGDNYVVAVDAYNGTVLWERDLPESIRLGAFKNCGSMAVGNAFLYIASADTCLALDVETGETAQTFTALTTSDNKLGEWGYVATVDGLLLGTTAKPGANWRIQDVDTQTLIWRDEQPVVTSDVLFAVDPRTGKNAWTYRPEGGVIVNPTLAAGGGRVYSVESANPETFAVPDGRIKLDALFDQGARLVALNLQTGKPAWQTPVDLSRLEHVVFMSHADDTLVISGTRNVQVEGSDKPRVRYDLWAFDALGGNPLWNSTQTPVPDHILQGPHGEQVQHSAIVSGVIYNTGFALHLRTGEPYEGWKWQKSDKCGTLSASASCIFSRFVTPRMFSIESGEYLPLTSVTRPGCWINILPAGGLILIPEASAGCTCYYPIQTSVVLAPR